ncbi:9759_t:CDS:2, partial [Entrophospora sp. SA101]
MGDNSSVDENYLQEPDVEFNNGIVPIVDIDDSNTNNSLLSLSDISSEIISDAELCTIKEINYLSPEIDIVTRWNSTFYMLKKFIHLQPALQMLQVDNANVRRNYPMNEELQNVKDVTIMLEPIEHATKLLSASSYCTHGDVRFCFLSILEDLETHYNNDKFTQPMIANSIHHKLEEYWPFLDTSSQISSILDPCCKLSAFKEGERED